VSELVYIVVEQNASSPESVHFNLSDANQAIIDLEREYNGQYLFRVAPLLEYGERIDISEEDEKS
jgi:hypothetical protein